MDQRCSSTSLIVRSDNDDDDIIILDPPDVLEDDIKTLLNHLINRLAGNEEEKQCCQIDSISNKVKYSSNANDALVKTPVRFNGLFVSENFRQENRLERPYVEFLSNLGLDLCLESYSNEFSQTLSFNDRHQLEEFNKIFHRSTKLTCRICSFKTDSKLVLDQHYLTPHIVADDRYRSEKYRCTYCSFQTFRVSHLRRHYQRKHRQTLISDGRTRRYSCCFCTFDADDKVTFRKHQNRCQIEQERVRLANNLLAPTNDEFLIKTTVTKSTENIPVKPVRPLIPIVDPFLEQHPIDEPILIESDHDSLPPSVASSSGEEFIVSSDKTTTSTTDSDDSNDEDFRLRPPKKNARTTSIAAIPPPLPPLPTVPHLSSLSKLLVLNGARSEIAIVTPIIPVRPPPVPIQPKPISNCDNYQMCSTCGCYVFKSDFLQHFNEKHRSNLLVNKTLPVAPVPPVLIAPKPTNEIPQKIYLLSTSSLDQSSFLLNMIKCPWCDTNVEHIDVMTGHLMRYHRMTLAAAKVVVAEQMKLQGPAASQLSRLFRDELNQIQRDFPDRTYWKVVQPKVYLNRMNHISCFVCQENIDDIENHFLSSHQIPLGTMNKLKQCSLCGFRCEQNTTSFYEHQLRVHQGICYSSVLKQYLRFEPAPTADRPMEFSSRSLDTQTEKKFGCRKCDTSSRLFTFDELVEHLRSHHQLNVKLNRRCIFCSKTFLKGKEFNEHSLEHLADDDPSIPLRRCKFN